VKLALLSIFSVLAFTAAAFGQQTDTSSLKKARMSDLSQMAGTWRGSGWIQQGTSREEFSGTQLIQKKIDGLALLIDGKFVSPQGKVVYENLSVVTYDETARNYKLAAVLANGSPAVQDLKIVGDHYEWGFQIPKTGTVKYTIVINGDTWTQTGEFSRDGKAWTKTLEMNLTRVKLKRPPGSGSPSN